jgi:ABC-type branched-subunit amino acid transport system substrate-binding protein
LAEGIQGRSVALVNGSCSGQAFIDAFQEATGQRPELTSSGAYDATMTLMLAAMVASGDINRPQAVRPANIRRALSLMNNPHGFKVRPTVRHLRREHRRTAGRLGQ